MSKREDEKKKRDQREYHRRMRAMNSAHRMAHKLGAPFERLEGYVDEVKGDEGQKAWSDSDEIVAALETATIAIGKAIEALQAKPKNYVARVAVPKVKLKLTVGAVVVVIGKFRDDFEVVFTSEEMNSLTVVSMGRGRIFVRPPNDESSKPIPMRPSEVRVVEGGEPA